MTELRQNSLSIVDRCYQYMVDNNITNLNVYDFIDYIKPQLNLPEEEFEIQMSYFYTDLNLDGRFVCVEDGSWTLKDSLSVEDFMNFVEPSIHKFELEDEEEIKLLEDEEDVTDDVDELLEDEEGDDSEDDYYELNDEGIVSKYKINPEDEEF
ncbi:DNA-directed RNA polymerase subunit delta [Gemella sp. GH3]|uniref:DNA-directed RNA polymerase subunit delta n=1 Tax=unclassified Gemella TaxID=2624949 RepID=UPI0015D005C0|nr:MULTISPECIES: DNA-directed RNA polymerase subunit delta [unclassified Gemella]MBF0713763.1 DNA-directed RNA polymerase subunit delta [Gemella sp. GH3.1]NYS50715.1 DNA-directed RNA polymerase subunit delta [Gemella sp. GH3]